jgi:hypothetical protein
MEPVRLGATMLPDIDIDIGSGRCASPWTTWPSTTTAIPTATSTRYAMSRSRAVCTTATPAAGITSRDAAVHGIDALKDGLVGRGVLLDIPRLRGASRFEPGEHVLGEELMASIARELAPWSSMKVTRSTACSGSLATMPVSDWPAARSSSDSVTGRQPTTRRPQSAAGKPGCLPANQEPHRRTP